MVYKIDGSSHNNGVKSEKIFVNFLNNKENFEFISDSLNKALGSNIKFHEFNFVHKGGTKSRDDVLCLNNNIKLSLKTKKLNGKKYKGTFDLINTSDLTELIFYNVEFEKAISEWNIFKTKIRDDKVNEKIVRNAVSESYKKILNTITIDQLNSIFNKIEKLEDDNIEVIRDYVIDVSEPITKNNVHFLEKNWFIKEFKNEVDHNQKISTSKTSSFLMNKDNTNGIFRIRVVLNNGVSALLREVGISQKIKGKNNNSLITIKIQVDKVREVVEKYDVNIKNNKRQK